MIRGNLGEWSEVYVFLKLLVAGEVPESDSSLKLGGNKLKIVRLLRDDSSGLKIFETGREFYDQGFGRVTKDELEHLVSGFPATLAASSGVFELPKVESTLTRLGLNRIKASSREKIDLRAVVTSYSTGSEFELGFSIKSELGGSSTLLNASSHTLFSFRLPANMSLTNLTASGRVRQLVSSILDSGIEIDILGPKSQRLRSNLAFFGESLWELFSKLLLLYYSGQGKSVLGLLEKLSANETDLKKNTYQVGQFLKAVALGMTPGSDWGGDVKAYGGYLIVTKEGNVAAIPTTNEDEFRNYLLSKSFFDTPSTSRHHFGEIYKMNNENLLDLSMQIRFA